MSNAIVSMQVTDAVWVSMLMSALAGIVAVCLMIATFYCIRYSHACCAADPAPLLFCDFTVSLPCDCSAWHECSQRTDKSKYKLLFVVLINWRFGHDRRTRGLGPAGQAGYQPLDGCADGMSAEQMRALPIVIAEKRASRRAASGEDGQLHKAPELIDLLPVGHPNVGRQHK